MLLVALRLLSVMRDILQAVGEFHFSNSGDKGHRLACYVIIRQRTSVAKHEVRRSFNLSAYTALQGLVAARGIPREHLPANDPVRCVIHNLVRQPTIVHRDTQLNRIALSASEERSENYR